MTDLAHWEQLQQLFHLAHAAGPSDWERILDEACPDPTLRQRALSILQAAEQEGSLPPAFAPSLIGPYRLIRLLGSGGIGTVYLTERIVGDVAQQCALKMLAPHAAGPQFVERFHREQHILASLDHPNITRMQDAGITAAGQPYLVMEYVNGVHLDAYCDANRLTIEHRLNLFLHICDAVAYAHRMLIVHLDLKPSNTLVTHEGTVKLLDFGTSKLLHLDGGFTSTLLATPAYASPEQLRGEPVSTLCDVYSLGAMLFELLGGQRPEPAAGSPGLRENLNQNSLTTSVTAQAATARKLTETRLRQRLAGDLTNVVEKCLRSRPEERYVSVNALVNDIQRHLEGRPVLARPQTFAYRFRKFVLRHRLQVGSAVAVSAVLAGSLTYAGLKQRRAVLEGERALRMQTFLYSLLKLANSNHTGKPAATLPEFLRLGVTVLPQYIREPRDLRQAQLALAESMFNNEDYAGARPAFDEVIRSARAGGDDAALAEAEAFAGALAYNEGRNAEGEHLTADALQLSEQKKVPPSVLVWSEIYYAINRENNGFRDDRNVSLLQDAVSQSRAHALTPDEAGLALTYLGEDLEVRGRLPEAATVLEGALEVYAQDPLALCERSEVYSFMGAIRHNLGDEEGSLQLHRQAYQGYARCSTAESRNALTEQDYISGQLLQLGHPAEALPILEANLPLWRGLVGENPDLAETLYYLSRACVETGQWQKAAQYAAEMIHVQEGKVATGDRRFGMGQWIWARALAGEQRYVEALPHAQQADELLNHNAVTPAGRKLAADVHALDLEIAQKAAANPAQ